MILRSTYTGRGREARCMDYPADKEKYLGEKLHFLLSAIYVGTAARYLK